MARTSNLSKRLCLQQRCHSALWSSSAGCARINHAPHRQRYRHLCFSKWSQGLDSLCWDQLLEPHEPALRMQSSHLSERVVICSKVLVMGISCKDPPSLRSLQYVELHEAVAYGSMLGTVSTPPCVGRKKVVPVSSRLVAKEEQACVTTREEFATECAMSWLYVCL